MPQLGESIAEATIVSLGVKVGDQVKADDEIIEVETNKAAMGITVPCDGTVSEITAELNVSYPVGAVLGYLEVSQEAAERHGPAPDRPTAKSDHSSNSSQQPKATRPTPSPEHPTKVEPTVKGLPVPVSTSGASYLSPRMKARMEELGLHAADLAGLAGSGAGGRVTIDDFETFLSELENKRVTPASSMRVAVADAMRRSWTRPLATVGRRIPLDKLLAHRKAQTEKAGPALYLLRALAIALAEESSPAGRLIGDRVVHPPAIDIGFAVEAEDGVLVPVIRRADQQSLVNLIARYDQLVNLARQRRLPLEATGGSIATITNFGSFGIEWATPIPLPEQTLVLGLGSGKKVPHWDAEKDSFIPVTQAELTLSFDHRVLDGGGAGRLLARVSELLQTPEIL